MATASYKLAKVVGGVMHYAEVTATAEFAAGRTIAVSPASFAWLKGVYGPQAWEWPECEAFRASAVSGVEFALRHISGRDGVPEVRVTIDRIHAVLADTSPDDVAYAAVFAVWKALGVEGNLLPQLPSKRG